MDIKKAYKLSSDILTLSRNSIIVNLRFLDVAMSMLRFIPNEEITTIATNGKYIFYHPFYILKLFKLSKEMVTRSYIHMLMHCVFRHNIISTLCDKMKWNLACDIAVENIINDLNLSVLSSPHEEEQKNIISKLKPEVKYITAEKIYQWLLDGHISEAEIIKWSEIFGSDNHDLWYIRSDGNPNGNSDGNQSNDDNSTNSDVGQGNSNPNGNQNAFSDENVNGDGLQGLQEPLEEAWKEIAEKMQTDLETFSKEHGSESGGLMQNLIALNREKYDYTEFLKKFAVMGEAMKINDDEFDYIFYTYGMSLFADEGKKMPLIEPLEYKEVKKIKEFVIAIDTSGSVSGPLVQRFIQKTYNILKQEESFFTKINLHIIQCDTKIHEDKKITTQEEFDDYLKNMKLYGFGGTDFRPVFSYVDQLIKNREFTNLKGLIYFTDGWGDFPRRQPDYNTAFVFIDDDYNNPDVPVWAIKLVLQSDEV